MAKSISIETFIAGLQSFESGYITRDRIAEFCAENRVERSSLEPHVLFRDDRYTRNLVYRDPLFEVMVICWRPGQATPIHTHNGQLGWMTVEQGAIDVSNYRYVSCNAAENQNVSGIDCLGGATEIDIQPTAAMRVHQGSPVATVDKVQTIHRMRCPSEGQEPAVTLHVYSLPFDSCVSFDTEAGRCGRRSLFWDTEYGRPAAAAARPLPVAR